jgi:hypothetical protein
MEIDFFFEKLNATNLFVIEVNNVIQIFLVV